MSNELVIKIENKDGINVVSSRVIAEQLGKEHKHVLESLDNILESHGRGLGGEIIASEYINERGRIYREYLLTKNGFTLYMFNIQGYNDFKIAYINRFNEMEKALQEVTTKEKLLLQLFSNDALQVANAHKALVEMETKPLKEKIEQDKPLVDFANQVSTSNDCILIREYCKILADENIKIGQNKLYDWLRENNYILKNKTEPTQYAINLGLFEVSERVIKNALW